jgi:hypothetical protein
VTGASPGGQRRSSKGEHVAECKGSQQVQYTLGQFLSIWNEQGAVKGTQSMRCASVSFRVAEMLQILHDWQGCQVVLRCTRMLAESGYAMNDIEVCFATALAKMRFEKRVASCVGQMGSQERVLVAVLQTYCSHSVIFDEFVPFEIWYEWLLAPFCSKNNANGALSKVCVLNRWRFLSGPDLLCPLLAQIRQDGAKHDGAQVARFA